MRAVVLTSVVLFVGVLLCARVFDKYDDSLSPSNPHSLQSAGPKLATFDTITTFFNYGIWDHDFHWTWLSAPPWPWQGRMWVGAVTGKTFVAGSHPNVLVIGDSIDRFLIGDTCQALKVDVVQWGSGLFRYSDGKSATLVCR